MSRQRSRDRKCLLFKGIYRLGVIVVIFPTTLIAIGWPDKLLDFCQVVGRLFKDLVRGKRIPLETANVMRDDADKSLDYVGYGILFLLIEGSHDCIWFDNSESRKKTEFRRNRWESCNGRSRCARVRWRGFASGEYPAWRFDVYTQKNVCIGYTDIRYVAFCGLRQVWWLPIDLKCDTATQDHRFRIPRSFYRVSCRAWSIKRLINRAGWLEWRSCLRRGVLNFSRSTPHCSEFVLVRRIQHDDTCHWRLCLYLRVG